MIIFGLGLISFALTLRFDRVAGYATPGYWGSGVFGVFGVSNFRKPKGSRGVGGNLILDKYCLQHAGSVFKCRVIVKLM